jgi:hypothetical protein
MFVPTNGVATEKESELESRFFGVRPYSGRIYSRLVSLAPNATGRSTFP